MSGYRIITKLSEAETEVKKSRFLAALAPCRSEEEARAFLESVKKKHYDARHNCFAFRIGDPEQVFERQSDDGEPQGTAGKPMLEILKGNALYDVCAVVTRYFGGTLLGTGGLLRAYSDALREALNTAPSEELKRGIRLRIACDYAMANRVKSLAARSELFTEREEYAENCTLYYLLPETEEPSFSEKVREMSAGKAETERLSAVLYYGMEKPEVYKILE
ncbi:MAG: YigZ family protein [Eubacteriales bacterium]|nr:YigZ family protein [Eubacteriales bacterium]